MNLREALLSLDVTEPEHWTTEDLPALQPLTDLMGEKVTRQAVNKIARGFTRANRVFPGEITERTRDDEDFRADTQAEENANPAPTDDDSDPEADDGGYNAHAFTPTREKFTREDCDAWYAEIAQIDERLRESETKIQAIRDADKGVVERRNVLSKMIAEHQTSSVYQDDIRRVLRLSYGDQA